MNGKLVTIGNSKGVRLPKKLIADWSENQLLIIQKKGESIVISPIKSRREDWVDQIKNISLDDLEGDCVPNDFDINDWNW